SLLGTNRFCLFRLQGDGLVTEDSQNMAKVFPPPLNHTSIKTGSCHIPEPSDVTNIIAAIPKQTAGVIHGIDGMQIRLGSPADLIVADPVGQTISKTFNSISLSLYDEIEEGDSLHDVITIPLAVSGTYNIQVIPEPTALPSDTFSLEVIQDGV